jgi:hypothetical protein
MMDAPQRNKVVSSFTIIKGSMITETYEIFRGWDFTLSREENLSRMKEENPIGATSVNWLRDVYKVLHRRYDPNGPDRPLVELAKAGCSYDTWRPILLWHMTRDEFLVRDFLVNWLYPQFREGILRIRAEELHPYLEALHAKGLVEEKWTKSTLNRVACGLLRIAADFGLLKGTAVREFEHYHLPERSFIYLLHALHETIRNAHDLVRAPDWRMYLMDTEDVERELFRLHQFRKLRYEVAGSIAQLSLPNASALEYVRGLAA